MQIKVKCPHCGNEQWAKLEWLNSDYNAIEDLVCESCDKEFDVDIEFESFPKVIDYETCDCCKRMEKEREMFFAYKWANFPSGYKKLCNECFTKKFFEKMESDNNELHGN